ncbi:KAT8 regulatory NSL complex subunit 2-like isoform X2 [Amphibalanus amphitrite]|uniref:KAT8 regulatory NSL complex subunit 2-like isoform X2 n=1 Tax=Amphibalanus amphitrite TaxID=1232801 RepID=UPI001C917C06|nr:KAT8 regulatory NSL complex subunit 2-like isoform X2 [Amphibalanus amphitrite]
MKSPFLNFVFGNMPRIRQMRGGRRVESHPTRVSVGTVCRHPHHFCQKECLEGFSFCSAHILEDRSAPYRPCAFVYSNGRKCGTPVPKKDSTCKKCGGSSHGSKKGSPASLLARLEGPEAFFMQCQDHRRRILLARERAERARPPKESVAVVVEQIQQSIASAAAAGPPGSTSGAGPSSTGEGWEAAQRALQYGSDSESGEGEAEGDRTVEGPLEPSLSSDECLSGLSDDEHTVLRHAGVYTDDEVIRLAERRLRRLQHLYLGQFERLQHVMKNKRRAFLLEVAREKEAMKSISGAPRETVAEQEAYDLLRAYGHHQKTAGKDYWFWQQRLEKRAAEAGSARTRPLTRCAHAEGRVRCTLRTVPLSKFCLKHIIQDQHQVLFRPCGGGSTADPCPTPVAGIQPETRCKLHTPLPEDGPVRMPQPPPDPVETILGELDGDDLALDETQSELVASIANTLMASAGRLETAAGGASEPLQGGAAGAGSKSGSADGSGQRSEVSSEVDVTGGTRSGSPSEGAEVTVTG